jgi:prepilin peptidase CpaA
VIQANAEIRIRTTGAFSCERAGVFERFEKRVSKSMAEGNYELKFMIYTVWTLAIVIGLLAGWIDWRSHRIPNWLTVSGFFAGIALNTIFFHWGGTKQSLLGAAMALGILLPVVLLRGLGAGDWKLMGALGAIVGSSQILDLLMATILFAGLIAIVQIVLKKRVFVTLRNMWELVRGYFIFGLKPNAEISLDNKAASTLPFGVAAAVATVLCWGALLAGI